MFNNIYKYILINKKMKYKIIFIYWNIEILKYIFIILYVSLSVFLDMEFTNFNIIYNKI